jgi:hypothetical protein
VPMCAVGVQQPPTGLLVTGLGTAQLPCGMCMARRCNSKAWNVAMCASFGLHEVQGGMRFMWGAGAMWSSLCFVGWPRLVSLSMLQGGRLCMLLVCFAVSQGALNGWVQFACWPWHAVG